MSGYSGSTFCPNCGDEDAELYTDRKPFDYIYIQCLECGLVISPKLEYMDLDELNQSRLDAEKSLVNKLPNQSEDIW